MPENDWKKDIKEMLNELVEEYELPKGSLCISDNYGQSEETKDTIISHTVFIWEPNYPRTAGEKPEQNKLVLNIKSKKDDLEISLRESQEKEVRSYLPEDAEEMKKNKTDISNGLVRIRIKNTSQGLVRYNRENMVYCINNYVSKENKFACCSRYEACSDAKKCLLDNKLFSTACSYRENLEQGKILYGKNRNID